MFGLPLLVALVFGSLISPTYPVAVLGVLRAANL
jgi:CPA1 family monovalent cation:H+ antiporter